MKSFDNEDSESNTGRWKYSEHQAFIDAIKMFGKNWKQVAEYIGTRSSTQVRSHAQKYFLKENSKGVSRQQSKELYMKNPGKCYNTDRVDVATQYGEGITFPDFTQIQYIQMFL